MILLQIIAALAISPVPTLDSDAFCRSSETGTAFVTREACEATERQAHRRLVRDWPKYPTKIRNECAAALREAPEATYAELWICIDIQLPKGLGDGLGELP